MRIFSSSSSFLLLSSVKNWITSCYIWVHKHIILFQFLFNSTIFQTRNGHSIRRAQVVSFYSHSFPQSQMYFENSVLIVLCALWRLFSTFDFIMFFSFAKNCVVHTIWCSLVLLAGNKKKYFQPPNKTRINIKKNEKYYSHLVHMTSELLFFSLLNRLDLISHSSPKWKEKSTKMNLKYTAIWNGSHFHILDFFLLVFCLFLLLFFIFHAWQIYFCLPLH